MFHESWGTTRTSSSRIWSRSPISTIRTYARWTDLEKRRNSLRYIFARFFARRKENPTRKYYFFCIQKQTLDSRYKSTSYFNQRVLFVVVHSQKENRNKMFFIRWEKDEKREESTARTHTYTRHTCSPLNTTSNTLFSLQRNDDVWATVSPILRHTLCDRVFRVNIIICLIQSKSIA